MFSGVLAKIIYKLFLRHIKPEILGYKDSKGNRIKDTRVSNMAHLSNKKNIFLGENVFVGHFNYIDGYDKVVIGEGCQITNYVNIVTHSSHNAIRVYGKNYSELIATKGTSDILETGLIEIGEYTYVGPHSTVMPNSKIGKGCIISAYSYVSGVFPDYSIIRGQPARVVGSTKDKDVDLLRDHPEFKNNYFEGENS